MENNDQNPRDIRHYDDGTASVLRKMVVYNDSITFLQS